MRCKWVVACLLITMVALAVVAAQQSSQDLPPGVLPGMWIPINANAGIALSIGAEQLFSYRGSALTVGTLMIKSHGKWQRVYLEGPPPNGLMPIK